jgi:uncharacterized delta-60 repeat protein
MGASSMLRRNRHLQNSHIRRLRVERLEDRRLLAAGDLDLSFGGDGIVTTAVGVEAYANDMQVQSDGKIVVAGYTYNSSSVVSALLMRYNPDGSLDTSFSGDGIATFSSGYFMNAMAIQADGKIVITGRTGGGLDTSLVTFRFNADGSFDNTFGLRTLNIGAGTDEATDVAIQADGKVVVAGYGYVGLGNDFVLIRYNTNGSLDTSFDGDGWLTTGFGASNVSDNGNAVAIQADGKIVVAGGSQNGSKTDFALARYNANGSLDTSFDGDGKLTTAIGSTFDTAFGLAIQSDGRIVAAGRSDSSNADFAAARYNTDGSLDTSFDGDGKLTTAMGSAGDIAHDVVVQADGKIVLVGYSQNPTNYDFALARYDANGSPDTTFSGDGKVITVIASASDFAFGGALQTNGKIVVAGFSGVTSNTVAVLARYEANNPPTNPGDYNNNTRVDAADYVLWRKTAGTTNIQSYSGADGSGNGAIGPEDYDVWRVNYDNSDLGSAAGDALFLTPNARVAAVNIEFPVNDHNIHRVRNRESSRPQIVATHVGHDALLACLTNKSHRVVLSDKSAHDENRTPVAVNKISVATLDVVFASL